MSGFLRVPASAETVTRGGRRCTVCALPEREAIDRYLASGESTMAELARRYGLGEGAVRRHRDNHLSYMLALGLKAEEIAGIRSVAGVRPTRAN